MKKILVAILLALFVITGYGYAFAGNAGYEEPAPNSGDGISDGSGYEAPNGPNDGGSGDSAQGYEEPAPNSGDGIPDGPGR